MQTDADIAEEIKARSASGAATKLAGLAGDEIVATLLRLNPGFAQEVLGALDDPARERVLAAAPETVARQWQRNAFYAEATIGRMMEPVVAGFPGDATVAEVIEVLRETVKAARITYAWVVSGDDQLIGIITMRDLLFSSPQQRLDEIMEREVFALTGGAKLEEAMKLALDRHYPVYPVVDGERRLIGLVRGQVMFEAQAVEITMQAGTMVGLDKEERASTPLWQSFRMRHPWLQVNLLTAFCTALVVSAFDDTIKSIVVLAAFLPVLSCLAGNNGCQALAITLRALTLGELEHLSVRELLTKEAKLGALNGFFTGLVGAVAMYVFASALDSPSPFLMALVMLVAMVVTCVVSCVLGTFVPLVVRRYGADPATASSIFLLTATDIFGMGFMLVLATAIVL